MRTREDKKTRIVWLSRLLVLCVMCSGFIACFAEPEPGPISVPEQWSSARLSPGHTAHLEQGLTCGDCHDLSASNMNTLKDDVCMSCHDDQVLHHGKLMNPGVCQDCHQFRAPDATTNAPANADEEPVFHQPNDCLSCHNKPQKDHAAVAVHQDQPCLSCHQPHGEKAVETDCRSCHEQVDLHHGERSSDTRSTMEQCLDCHAPHQAASSAQTACPTCHQLSAHPSPEKEALGAPQIPLSATHDDSEGKGHSSCSSCHNQGQSHDLRKSAALGCINCHENHPTLGGSRNKAHQACENCHNPHDVSASAHAACSGCHQDQKTDHPAAHKNQGDCATCHQVHPRQKVGPHGLGQACSSCHEEPAQDHGHGEANLECSSCHSPHQFLASAASEQLCARCHTKQLQQVEHNQGHQQCSSCHMDLPHHPGDGGGECKSCHQQQQHADNRHDACTTCHQPHSGSQSQSCPTCHSAEAHSSPQGHSACTTCHDPHRQDPRAVVKECADCHQKQHANNPHNALQGQCSNCHRPHGPGAQQGGPAGPATPPACSTCHQQHKLPSLHLKHGGSECSTCHSPHDSRARRNREDCLSCHQRQKNHQPQAENCASCHLFRPAVK